MVEKICAKCEFWAWNETVKCRTVPNLVSVVYMKWCAYIAHILSSFIYSDHAHSALWPNQGRLKAGRDSFNLLRASMWYIVGCSPRHRIHCRDCAPVFVDRRVSAASLSLSLSLSLWVSLKWLNTDWWFYNRPRLHAGWLRRSIQLLI